MGTINETSGIYAFDVKDGPYRHVTVHILFDSCDQEIQTEVIVPEDEPYTVKYVNEHIEQHYPNCVLVPCDRFKSDLDLRSNQCSSSAV